MARTLGQALRERRIRLGDTQESAAEKIGCDIATLGRWERHRARVLSCREALRTYLGCSRRAFEELLVAQAAAVERHDHRRTGRRPRTPRERSASTGSATRGEVAVLDLDGLRARGWSCGQVTRALLEIERETVAALATRTERTFARRREICAAYPGFWRVLYREPREILGYWQALPVGRRAFRRLLRGEVAVAALEPADLEHVALPGTYKLALGMFTLREPARSEENRLRLFRSLIDRLVDLARAGIRFDELVAPAYGFEGERLCRLLGMEEVAVPGPAPQPADGPDPPVAPLFHLRLLPFPRRGRLAQRKELAALYADPGSSEEDPPAAGGLVQAASLRAMWNGREMLVARRRVCELAAGGPVGTGGPQALLLGFFDELHHFLDRGEVSRHHLWLVYGATVALYHALLREAALAYRRAFADEGRHAGFFRLAEELEAHGRRRGVDPPTGEQLARLMAEERELVELLLAVEGPARETPSAGD